MPRAAVLIKIAPRPTATNVILTLSISAFHQAPHRTSSPLGTSGLDRRECDSHHRQGNTFHVTCGRVDIC
jgi:hypothetical protein